MVNLFSFGCHVIDRAYERAYRLYGWGREDYQKEGCECLRLVLANPHLLYWTFTIWSIDSCQNGIATDQYHMTISWAHVSTHRGEVIYLEAVRSPVNCFTRSRSWFNQCSISYFLASLRAQLIMYTYWTSMLWSIDTCQNRVSAGITWAYRGLRCRPSKSSIFWSYPLTSY